MNEERKLYYMEDTDENKIVVLSLTLDQVGLLDFLNLNNCLCDCIKFTKADNNPETISGSQWYEYIGQ